MANRRGAGSGARRACSRVALLLAALQVATAPAGAGETPVRHFVTGSGHVMSLYIHPDSADFAGLRHDLALAPGLVVARDSEGKPQCSFDAERGIAGQVSFLPEECQDEAACTGLRVELTKGDAAASPFAALMQCNVGERPDLGEPESGCSYRVDCAAAEARDADGASLPVACDGGWMVVTDQPPPVRASLSVEPADPVVGDEIEVTFSAPGAYYAGYTLFGLGDALEGPSYLSDSFSGQVVFRLQAVASGRVALSGNVNHEIRVGCSNYFWFQFVNASADAITIDIARADPNDPNTPDEPTVTPTVTVTASPTPTSSPSACHGDCNGDGQVTVDELLMGVSIALGLRSLDDCPAFADVEPVVTVAEVVAAINAALDGCR